MTLEEQGAYRNLLDEASLRGGPLPNDERILAKACGDALKWQSVKSNVMKRFRLTPDGWRNDTLDSVLHESRRRAVNQANYRARHKTNGRDNDTDNDTDNGDLLSPTVNSNDTDNAPDNNIDNPAQSPSPSPSPYPISGSVSVSSNKLVPSTKPLRGLSTTRRISTAKTR